MNRIFHLFAIGALLAVPCLAERGSGSGGGRGGPFLEYHSSTLSNFDTGVSGSPVVIGGVGFGWATRNFRIGGGGAGGFLWNGSDNLNFGMGYGGVVGEYIVAAPWLVARMMIGGGGYSIAKTVNETDSTRTLEKLASGAFILFHPQIIFDFKVHNWMSLGASIGYFLPNVGKLHSLTVGFNLMFGKT